MNRPRIASLLLGCALACGDEELTVVGAGVSALGAPPNEAIEMPDVPAPGRGQVRVLAVGRDSLTAAWRATVDWCPGAPALRILADDSTSGTLMVLRPAGDDFTGVYPVLNPDSVASRPVGHIGVLLALARRGFTFQGIAGSVEVRADGRRVSGEFQAEMKEVGTELRLKYAGSFDRLRVHERTEDACTELGISSGQIDEPSEPRR